MTPSENMWHEAQAGRLDAKELHDRLDCCHRARTLADLDGLVDDLPRGRSARYLRHAGHGWG